MEQTKQKAAQLRLEAELRSDRRIPSFVEPLPGENLMHELMHELRVSHIELAMQNETLRQSQIELEKSRDRYVDFYDFALVGYLTLSSDAMIDEINLPGAELLGEGRKKLMQRRFATFVAPAEQDRWHRFFLSALGNDQKSHCKLAIQQGNGTLSNVMLICQRLQKPDKRWVLRIVLSDICDDKQPDTAPPNDAQ
jgi:PAS domain-containing protein